MKDLKVRQKTIKILQEKTINNLFDLSHSNFLSNKDSLSPKARIIKAKMNYWDLIKIKSFCTARKQSAKLKGKYLQMTYLIKGIKLNIQKTTS